MANSNPPTPRNLIQLSLVIGLPCDMILYAVRLGQNILNMLLKIVKLKINNKT